LLGTGVCRWSNITNAGACHYGFPQRIDILQLIGQDIGSTNSTQYSAWALLLDLGSSTETNRPQWNSFAQAAAAMLILSVMWNAGTLVLAARSLQREKLRCLVLLDLVDAVFVLVAAILWTYMYWYVTNGTSNSLGVGPGIVLLWLAFVAKLCVTKEMVLILFVKPIAKCVKCCNGRPGRRVQDALDQVEDGIWKGSLRLANVECC
jgi:hypothetical protein